jgi:pyruvate dehydrogenase E2 component (dihydrolipoamide acetyltransferase)
MAEDFTMPQLGLTMTEGTIIQWLKAAGDPVALGEVLVEVETEKVNYQVESTLEGVLLEILVPEGSIAQVKAPIAVIGQPGEPLEKSTGKPHEKEKAADKAEPTAAVSPNGKSETGADLIQQAESEVRIKASPIAKRLAREENLSLAEIPGTGPEGRIVERDINRHLEERKVKVSPLAAKLAEEYQVDLSAIPQDRRIMKDDVLAHASQRSAQTASVPPSAVQLTGMRKVIAERMSMSWQTSPHVNMTVEVDMTASTELKEKLTQATGQKISFTDIIVKCSALALKELPVVNASLIDGKIISHEQINVGIAVALDNGLIVPVIRNADRKTVATVRKEIASLSSKARSGGLSADDINQGTFTVSNLGMYGIDHFTPIINPPQSAILGVCRVVDRAIVADGEVVVRPMMNLCLSFDHRLIDGALGAQFLARLRELLEQPLLLV